MPYRRAPICPDCGRALQCTCCGISPHEGFCELNSAGSCQDCTEQRLIAREQGLEHWYFPTDADEPVLDSHVKDMTIDEIDAALAALDAPVPASASTGQGIS